MLRTHWRRGGFSFLAESDTASHEWCEEFIRTFLERDLPQLGVSVLAGTMHRFWQMASLLVAPVREAYPAGKAITVTPLPTLLNELSHMKG